MENPNSYVPVETLFKWQTKELLKLRRMLDRKTRTIERLRNNIRMLLNDSNLKYEIACDARVREYARNMVESQREVHRLRMSQEKILQTLLNYQLKYGKI